MDVASNVSQGGFVKEKLANDVSKFLNRILGLRVRQQNSVSTSFFWKVHCLDIRQRSQSRGVLVGVPESFGCLVGDERAPINLSYPLKAAQLMCQARA